MLARSKLHSTESKISEALINNEISHDDFMMIINKEKKYWELKERLEWWIVKEVMLKKLTWLKKAKKISIKEVINAIKLLITYINNILFWMQFYWLQFHWSIKWIREHWPLGFITLNGNLALNLKPTHSPLLHSKGQFTFLKTKSSHSSGIVVYPPKFEFLRN